MMEGVDSSIVSDIYEGRVTLGSQWNAAAAYRNVRQDGAIAGCCGKRETRRGDAQHARSNIAVTLARSLR